MCRVAERARDPGTAAPPAWRMAGMAAVLGLLGATGAGCRPGIATVNATPERYYAHELRLYGRVGEVTPPATPDSPTVFQLVAESGERMIVVTAAPFTLEPGDWVRARGQFNGEVRVGERVLYDALVATSIRRARAPLVGPIL
jgi:hypothetical protein